MQSIVCTFILCAVAIGVAGCAGGSAPPHLTIDVAASPSSYGTNSADAPQPRPVDAATAKCPTPEYPSVAEELGVMGTTTVLFVVEPSGIVSKATVKRRSGGSQEHAVLDNLAVETTLACRFPEAPGTLPALVSRNYVWRLE